MIKRKLGLPNHVEEAKIEWYLILKGCKGSNQIKRIVRVHLAATLYYIWKERRNLELFQNRTITEVGLANHILRKAKHHPFLLIYKLRDSNKARIICDYLSLSLTGI